MSTGSMPTGRDAIIAGGGIGGLTAALCLAKRGVRCVVLEQAPAFSEVGAGIQLSPNATRVLFDLGLDAGLESRACVPTKIDFRHWRTGRVFASQTLGQLATERFGFPYLHMHRADLLEVLVAEAQTRPEITLVNDAIVRCFDNISTDVSVRAGSRTLSAELLVGADGIHSTVRSCLFGPEAPRFTGNVAWRGLIPRDELRPELAGRATNVWWGPGRHVVHYPVRNGAFVNCVVVMETSNWRKESWSSPGDPAELVAGFDGWHPDIRALMGKLDPETCFKWALFDRPAMPRWSVGRVTLLGDACHPTLPFLAQGAAMAIEDAAVLARCVASVRDVETALLQYESTRRPRTARIQAASRRNAWIFHLSRPAATFRNLVAPFAGRRIARWLYAYDALADLHIEAS